MGSDSAHLARTPWRIYRVGGQKVFAAPESLPHVRLAGIERFQPVTRKRAAYRAMMRLAIWLGIDGLLAHKAPTPIAPRWGFDFDAWLECARTQLERPDATPVIFWPPQRDRGRFYVHLIDSDLRFIGFAKVSLNDANDRQLLAARGAILEMNARNLRHSRVPRMLAFGAVCGHEYNIIESIPPGAAPLPRSTASYPRQAVEEFGGPTTERRAPNLEDLSWWGRFLERCNGSYGPFLDELRDRASASIRVRRVHGDLGFSNTLRHDGQLWVFDWEESRPDGPILVDEMSFTLAANFSWIPADPTGSLRRFADLFPAGDDPRRRADVMLALAFLHGAGLGVASSIIEHWRMMSPKA